MAAPPEHFDYIALGCGEAGKYIAWTLASKQGKKCAVVEQRWVGGSCPNIACLPSKNVIYSAKVAHELSLARTFGLGAYVHGTDQGGMKVQMLPVKARKARMVEGLVDTHLGMFKKTSVELIRGHGRFVGRKTIAVGDGPDARVLTADAIGISTGSRAKIDDKVPGLAEAKPLTHIDILDLEELPSHLVIVGGGYVGIEFAQAFRRFGSKVTVIERHDQILKNEDKDVVDSLTHVLEEEGIKLLTSTSVSEIKGVSGEEVQVSVTNEQGSDTIHASHILAAAGRVPNTAGIGLVEHGIELTPSGHVKVDEQLRTSIDGVFAVGDCAGSPYFTHIAFDDFRIVYSYLSGSPKPEGKTGRQVPSTLYTSPELAHVGLREREAQKQGIKYRLAKLPTVAILRSRTMDQTEGFAKALVEADGDRILGFTALCPSAGEMLPVVQLAMKLGVSYQEIASLVITHPTMCEGLVGLFNAVPPRV